MDKLIRSTKPKPIYEIAEKLGITEKDYLIPCGNYKAKISLKLYDKIKSKPNGKLILVTAMTPTPYGEGKTTVAIGLSMAFNKLQKSSIVCLRQPSLGPIFGLKGGGTGGGRCLVIPLEDINLHFTGDFHAVTSAHNLLAAILDNHIHFGNELDLDETEILFKRTIDLNDRSLRNIVVGLGGKTNGPAREDGFTITPASEIMAILSLSNSLQELKSRLCQILVGFSKKKKPVFAGELRACGSMAVLLRDAIKPNLVQTLENTPAFIHTGCFANIAHGTTSLVSMQMALKLAQYTVVEAGFGSDLGAEKFVNLVARVGNLPIDGAVIVATTRALKYHGGAKEKELDKATDVHLKRGLENLGRHIENLRKMNIPTVVALNLFTNDKARDIKIVKGYCDYQNVPFATFNGYNAGGEGGIELAETLENVITNNPTNYVPIYSLEDPIETKIEKVAKEIYGASDVIFSSTAQKDLKRINELKYNNFPICIAKTNLSLSDNPELIGAPKNFKITISQIRIFSGAGYVVPIAGDINLMPGLPKVPNALSIDLDDKGYIIGLK
ncbi:MAG: formate--tetrahydrofolate ligase [candidate division WOR-3 bacterium]|nr:formate--tetrahydrofolate ligase [candidate division WOR-3 bacterium]MCX7757656.1 formate--tetrahydrofolate ligase [candidate division WOR-3 bacterium]